VGTDGNPLGRRCGFSTAQGRTLGIFEAVEGNVLIYIHKEEALDDVERRYPLSTMSWWTTSCAS
jgi:hypothetical protein